ncbi:MAG TPA: carboxypeptidase-like regulatory domain-containing protein [Vicinamibacterales bacterium]|nr:carboxypeptidase-like regulatory domain-containing protein [Vicinamibacterales bacterium]
MGTRSIPVWFATFALVLALPVVASAQARILVDIRDEREQPLHNVRITVVHEKSGDPAGECRTDFAGRCVITLTALQRYVVRASLANYQPPPPRQLYPAIGDTRLSFNMWPPPPPPERDDSEIIVPGFIVGAVRSLTDEPIAGVSVQALSGGLYNGTEDTTREDGSFRIRAIPGTYTIFADTTMTTRKPGYVFEAAAYGAPVAVTAGQDTGPVILYPASFKLPAVNVTVVTPAGLPAAGAEVISFSHWRSFTGKTFSANNAGRADRDGIAPIPYAFPGTLVLTATATVGDEQLAGMEIVEVGNAPLDVFMRLGAAAQVSGRVEFAGLDRPLHGSGGIRVMPDPGTANAGYSVTDRNGVVGPNGDFTLKGLAGERCLILRELPSGWRLAEITQYGRPLEHNRLEFLEGQRVTGIVLHVVPGRDDMFPRTPPCPLTNR